MLRGHSRIRTNIPGLIHSKKGDGEGGRWMGRLVDGLIYRYMNRLVDGDDSSNVEIDGYVHGV